jgi:hypothetical protein
MLRHVLHKHVRVAKLSFQQRVDSQQIISKLMLNLLFQFVAAGYNRGHDTFVFSKGLLNH